MAGRVPIISAVLVLFALAISSDALEPGTRYNYQLNVQLGSKFDDVRLQFAGLALRSSLVLMKQSGSDLIVRMDRPEVASFNQPMDQLGTNLSQSQYQPLQAGLEKAFKVYLKDGAIIGFDTYPNEPKWVTNLKRGLLSFFHVKLVPFQDANNQERYFTRAENSVFGECDTDYLILPSGKRGENRLCVTKTRNMGKCKSRYMHKFMPVDVVDCQESEKDLQQYRHSTSIFQYELRGSPADYVIEQVKLDETSTFSAFGQEGQKYMIQTVAQMNLVNQSKADRIETEAGAYFTNTLTYEAPEDSNFYASVNLEQEHHLAHLYQMSSSVEQAMAAFDALVQENKAYMSAFEAQTSAGSADSNDVGGSNNGYYLANSSLSRRFFRLNELVSTLSLQKIEQLYAQVDERGEAHKRIFWDLMSVVGTNPSFVFMKRLITDGDAPSVKIKDFLTRLSFHIKMPSKSLFDEYVNLCKSNKVQLNQLYKRICSLPLASLIHQHCAKPHSKYLRAQQEGRNAESLKKPATSCQLATAEDYFRSLVQQPASDSPIGEQMFAIKMAAELGVEPSIDYLSKILSNQANHPTLRGAAMWSLAKVTPLYPARVKRLVVPYFYDQAELLPVRLAAFHNWVRAGMSLQELETLAANLREERSRQLVLYLNSYIKSMSKLGLQACSGANESNAKLVRKAFQEAADRHSEPGPLDSRAKLSGSWLPDFGYGSASQLSLIFSNESGAPTNLYYTTSEIMNGQRLSPLTIVVQAHGLDKMIKRVMGVNGILSDKDSILDVFSLKRRSKRQAQEPDVKQELEKVEKELGLLVREFSDVYIDVSVSIFGRTVQFMDRDSRELKKILSEDGTVKIPQIRKLLHSFNNHTNQHMLINFERLEVFNNELGLPVFQSMSDFQNKAFRLNSINLDVLPSLFKEERQGKPASKLSLALDARIGRHNEFLVKTGSILVGSRQLAGAGFHKKKIINFPIKMSLEANLLENKITITRQPIFDNMLYLKQQPFTFLSSYEPSLGAEVLPNIIPLYQFNNSADMRPFKWQYMTPMAVGLRAEGLRRTGLDLSMSYWRRKLGALGLDTANFMYTFSPTGVPLEMSLSTETTSENPTRELQIRLSWQHHHQHELEAEHQSQLSEVSRQLEESLASQAGRDQPQGTRPTTVHYQLALQGGSQRVRQVSLDIYYARTFDRLLHQWRAFYQRTPLEQVDANAQVTNLCWQGQLQFPRHQLDRLLDLQMFGGDYTANMSSEITFGDQCSPSSAGSGSDAPKVLAQARFMRSAEQRSLLEAALLPAGSVDTRQSLEDDQDEERIGRANPYEWLLRACKQERANTNGAALLAGSCVELMRQASELHSVQATLDYNAVPERWTGMARKLGALYMYARAGYMEQLDDGAQKLQRNFQAPDGRLQRAYLEANMSLDGGQQQQRRKISYELTANKYHILYRGVPITVPPLSTFPLLGNSYYQTVRTRAASQFCLLAGNQVTTFDNLTYTLNKMEPGCMSLLAKDCSPEANYAVLSAKLPDGNLTLKVYVGHKFRLELQSGSVKVNDQPVEVRPGTAPVVYKIPLGARTVQAFTLDHNGVYLKLDSPHFKFSLINRGAWVLVRQSKYYSGRSCGLCGDSNGEQLNELKPPFSRTGECENTLDFSLSYQIPSTCPSLTTDRHNLLCPHD